MDPRLGSRRLAVLLLQLCACSFGFGQATTRVTFDANNPAGNGTLPFDQYFTLTVKNLGMNNGEDTVSFILYELRRKKNGYLSATSATMEGVLADCKKYEAFGLKVVSDSVSVPQLMLLSPNRDYLIRVEGTRGLTTVESAALKEKLRASEHQLGNVMYQHIRSNPGFLYIIKEDSYDAYLSGVIDAYVVDASAAITAEGKLIKGGARAMAEQLETEALTEALAEWDESIMHVVSQKDLLDDQLLITGAGARRVADAMRYLLGSSITDTADVNNVLVSDTTVFEKTQRVVNKKTITVIPTARKQALVETTKKVWDEIEKLQAHIIEQALLPSIYTTLSSSYELNTKDNAKFHYSANFGGLYDLYGDKFRMFTSINFFLRPINYALPLDAYNYSWKQWLLARGSVSIGLTDNTMADAGSDKKGIIGDRGLMLGAGLRVLSFATINGGVLVYEQDDRNPLVTAYSTKFTPYIGLSANLELKSIFGLK